MTAKENKGMMEERLIELINSEIDGLNSASEHQELMKHVATNDEAARLYHDLLRTARALKSVGHAAPPSDLKKHVMNSIDTARPLSARTGGRFSYWREVFQSRSTVRYAVVFASGLCVGLLFLILAAPWQQHGEPDAASVSGSMAFFSDIHRLPVLESIRFEGEGCGGVFRTYKSGGNVFVEIEVESSDKFSVELNSNPEELRFDGIRRHPGVEGEVNVTQGKVVLSGTRSEQAVVAFSGGDFAKGSLEGRVYKGNVLVHRLILKVQ